MTGPLTARSPGMIMGMPMWTLAAAGYLPEGDRQASRDLRDKLAAVLSDPRYATGLSSFTDESVRVPLHVSEEDPLAAARC